MKSALNLLPPVYRRQRLARRRAVQWGLIFMVTLSTIFLIRWYKVREYHALRRQLEAISREGRPAQAMLREIAGMRNQIDQLQKHQTIAQELEQQRQVLALLGAVSKAARETGGRLRLTDCRVVDLQATAATEMGSDDATHAGTVTLVGVALDSPAVAEFHDGLLRSGLFADVKLIKSNEQNEVGTALYEYEVRCEL
jgi:glycine/D-amino acid oxidase-like deaminating enzyme